MNNDRFILKWNKFQNVTVFFGRLSTVGRCDGLRIRKMSQNDEEKPRWGEANGWQWRHGWQWRQLWDWVGVRVSVPVNTSLFSQRFQCFILSWLHRYPWSWVPSYQGGRIWIIRRTRIWAFIRRKWPGRPCWKSLTFFLLFSNLDATVLHCLWVIHRL